MCFRTGSSLDALHLLPRFQPYIDQQDIINLPAYNFYIKLSAVKPQEPMSGETVLPENEGDDKITKKVTESSRNTYGVEVTEQPATETQEIKQKISKSSGRASSNTGLPKKKPKRTES